MKPFCQLRPTVMAHRGFSSLFPENTLPAFIEASKYVNYIELDVWLALDGVLVVHHDRNLSRTCGVDALVTSMTSRELCLIDAGWSFSLDGKNFPFRGKGIGISTLETVFRALSQCHFVVEIKDTNSALVPELLAVIEKCEMQEKCLVASSMTKVLIHFREVAPEIRTNLGEEEIRSLLGSPKEPLNKMFSNSALQIPMKVGEHCLADSRIIRWVHEQNMEVHYWTINDPEDMKKLILMGADAIMTDNPPLAISVLKGMKLE